MLGDGGEEFVRWVVGQTLGGSRALLSDRKRLGLLYLHGGEVC